MDIGPKLGADESRSSYQFRYARFSLQFFYAACLIVLLYLALTKATDIGSTELLISVAIVFFMISGASLLSTLVFAAKGLFFLFKDRIRLRVPPTHTYQVVMQLSGALQGQACAIASCIQAHFASEYPEAKSKCVPEIGDKIRLLYTSSDPEKSAKVFAKAISACVPMGSDNDFDIVSMNDFLVDVA